MPQIKVDLHIHTPASRDYANKLKTEYLQILKSAAENDLSMIAFTDHFSVDGYYYVTSLIQETKSTYASLLKRGDADQNLLNQIKNEIEIFDKVKVLMGIELDINGIHFIVIFSDSLAPDDIRCLLLDLTNNEIENHWGDPEFMLLNSFPEVFERMSKEFNNNFLLYAPHIDSSKGLVEALKENGKLRQSIFESKYLNAVANNKPQTKDWLLNKYFPNLVRANKPHIIQESDYHGKKGQKLGGSYFTIDIDSKDFGYNELFKALNSATKIKTSIDYAEEEYDTFLKENPTIFCVRIEETEKITQYSAGIINSRFGYLRLELNIDQSLDQKEVIESTINKVGQIILDKLNILERSLIFKVFPYSKGKIILIFTLRNIKKLILYNSIVYIVDKKNVSIREANANEIESIVSRNTYDRFAKPKDKLINGITKNSNKVKNYLLSFSIFFKIQDKLKMFDEIKVEFHNRTNVELSQLFDLVEKYPNGQHNGNLIFHKDRVDVEFGRLRQHNANRLKQKIDHSYLRVQAPVIDYPNLSEIDSLPSFNEERLLIIPGGGSFIYPSNYKIYSAFPFFSIYSTSSDISFDLHFFAGYFKSSFFQWFISKIYTFEELFDFFLSNMHRQLPFFYTFDRDIQKQVKWHK